MFSAWWNILKNTLLCPGVSNLDISLYLSSSNILFNYILFIYNIILNWNLLCLQFVFHLK